jgi:hypothetical protein
MADDSGMDIDPAIAAAMGFSGFGTQKTGKKRKFENETFVDPSIGQSAKGEGANAMPLGERHARSSGEAIATKDGSGHDEPQQAQHAGGESRGQRLDDLEALRHGVKNARGDTVYFLPSFIEDPWKDLRPQ